MITVEDSCLHPEYPFLLWCMVANTKGWNITRAQVQRLLRIIYEVADCPYRDLIPNVSEKNLEPFRNPLLFDSFPAFAAPICSLILRANYGGMQFDQEMLKKHALNWHARMQTDPGIWLGNVKRWYPQSDNTALIERIESMVRQPPAPLEAAQMIPEGIDFHCFPILIQKCQEQVLGTPHSSFPIKSDLSSSQGSKQTRLRTQFGTSDRVLTQRPSLPIKTTL